MESTPKPTPPAWHCVLDRNMRQIYLGTDEAEATRLTLDGAVMRCAPSMGDAMLAAALAFGSEQGRKAGPPRNP